MSTIADFPCAARIVQLSDELVAARNEIAILKKRGDRLARENATRQDKTEENLDLWRDWSEQKNRAEKAERDLADTQKRLHNLVGVKDRCVFSAVENKAEADQLRVELAAAREKLVALTEVAQAATSIIEAWDVDDNDDYCRFVHRLEPHQRLLRYRIAAAKEKKP